MNRDQLIEALTLSIAQYFSEEDSPRDAAISALLTIERNGLVIFPREPAEQLRTENANLRKALKRAADMLQSIAGDIADGYSLSDLRGKYVMAVLSASDNALATLASAQRDGDRNAFLNEITSGETND